MPPKKFTGSRSAAADAAQTKKAKPTPEGWTDEAWAADCRRREVESEGRRLRAAKLQQKKAEATAKKQADEAARMKANADGYHAGARSASGLVFPPILTASQGSISSPSGFSPSGFSPSSPAVMTPQASRFSPEMDGEQFGAFNPNQVFGQCPAPRGPPAFNPEAAFGGPIPYAAVGHGLHRGPLPFHPSQASSSPRAPNLFDGMSADTTMADIITSGSNANAASASFFSQEEARTSAEQGLETQDFGEADLGEDGEVEIVKVKGKRKAAKETAAPRIKWTPLEDECLAESWKEVSMDACVGVYQNSERYWHRIKVQYDERRLMNKDFMAITTQRGDKALQNHWGIIQQHCSKWHGIQEEIAHRPESGANHEDVLNRALGMFRDDMKCDFKYHHVFSRISTCEKWVDTRVQLAKNSNGPFNPADKPDPASEGRPEFGQKKAKANRAMGAPSERLQASIELCLADAKKSAERREEKAEARWKTLLQTQGEKLAVLKTSAESTKRNNDLAFLVSCGAAHENDKAKAWISSHLSAILDSEIPQPASTTTLPSSAPPSAATTSAPSTATASPEEPPETSPEVVEI